MSKQVRYIRDTIASGTKADGSATNGIWTEIQAYTAGGTNVALNKAVTASVTPPDGVGVLPRITDGVTTARTSDQYYADFWNKPGAAVTVDLGQVYAIDKITIWHFWQAWTMNTKWEVSADGVTWETIWDYAVDGTYVEDEANGHSVSLIVATVPDAPTDVVATAGEASVSVAFTPPVNTGGTTITGYAVTLSSGQTATGPASPITVTAVNGVAVTATVKATNSVGLSVASAPSNSVTPAIDSTPPTLVSAMTNKAGTAVTLLFNEDIAGVRASMPLSAFALSFRTAAAIVDGANAREIVLDAITPAIPGNTAVTVTYTKPATNPLADAKGNQAASFGPVNVVNTVPVRPVLPGYVVKVYGDGETADFSTPDALATYINGLNCVTLNSKVMIYLDKNLAAAGKTYSVAGSNDSYYVTLRPMPGKSFDELEPDAAPGAIGTLGIEVACADTAFSQGIRLEALRLRLSGNQTALNMHRNNGNQQGASGGMYGCRVIHVNGGAAMVVGFGGASFSMMDNLIVIDAGNGFDAINDQGSVACRRNTIVRLNGAVGYAGINHEYSGNDDRDNVFAGCGGAPYRRVGTGAANNFTDTPLTTASSMVEYISGPFFDSPTNYRPAAGSALLGRGSLTAVSLNDNNGNNRGTVPDPGAFQRTPAMPLAIGAVSSQTVDGQSLTVEMNVDRAPASGTISLTPGNPRNGAVNIGPLPITLNGNGTASVTIDDIPSGDYLAPTILLTNAGGTNAVTGTSPISIMGMGNLLYDTGGVGVGGGGTAPTDPTIPAPAIAITTTDATVMAGKRATLNGTVSLQGDINGRVEVFMDPKPTGTPVSLGDANVSSGTWTKQAVIPPGLYELRAKATANGQTAEAKTGPLRVLNLVGNFNLPSA